MTRKMKAGLLSIHAVAIITSVSAVFYADKPLIFSHKKHIEDTAAECSGCHEDAANPKAVKTSACAECHDEDVGKAVLRPRASRPEIVFSHEIHNNVATCIDCHERTAKDKQRRNTPLQTYEKCTDCHRENGIVLPWFQCGACHAEANRNIKPVSHQKTWLSRHGKIGGWDGFKGHGNNCELCHTKSECKTCHQIMAPKSHTALWRIRSHGFVASMDRERCKTCHETGSCINCHLHTAPQNHRGAWPRVHGLAAKASPEKCKVCHSAAYGTSSACIECHGGLK